MKRHVWAALGFVACAGMVGGCGAQVGDTTARDSTVDASCVRADPSALRLWGSANYLPVGPAELMGASDLSARAVLIGVHPGFDWNDEDSSNPQVLLEFEVSEVFGAKGREFAPGESVFVVNDQGPIVVETGLPLHDLNYFKKALPVGTGAFLFLRDVTSQTAPYLEDRAKSFDSLMSGGIQGIVLDDCAGFRGGSEEIPDDETWGKVTSSEELASILRS